MVDDNWTTGFYADHTLEQFWGLRYIDDPILRRTDPEAVGGYWHVTDVQFSTMALLDNNADVYERVWYTPYGEARHHWGQDFDGDRDFDTADVTALLTKITGGDVPIDDPDYAVEMDRNRNGVLDADDLPSGASQSAVALGQISDLDATSGPDNWFGYAGYVWEGASGQYQVRFRNYGPKLGRWMQRDPAGYVDGMGLYEYVGGRAQFATDPYGLVPKRIQDLIDEGLYEQAEAELKAYYRRTDTTLFRLAGKVAIAADVLDKVLQSTSFKLGSVAPINKEGKCCLDGKVYEMEKLGTRLSLGIEVSASIDMTLFKKRLENGEEVDIPTCEAKGTHMAAVFGPLLKVGTPGGKVTFTVTGGVHIGPGFEPEVIGNFKFKPKLPLNFNISLSQLIMGKSDLLQSIEQISASLSVGAGASVGTVEWYSVSLKPTCEECE